MRTALFLLLASTIALFVLAQRTNTPTEPAQAWPYTAADAPDVSLAFAYARLTGKTMREAEAGPGLDVLAQPVGVPDAATQAALDALPTGAPLRAGVLDRYLHLDFGDGRVAKAQLPFPSSGVIQELVGTSEVDLVIFENDRLTATLTDRLFQILPIFILIGLLVFLLGRGATKSLGLSAGFAVVPPEQLTEGFADVAGIEQARGDLDDIVSFLRDPVQAGRLGGRMPKGVLFAGPPGTGKTLLARALAKEAGVPFLSIEASGVNQIFVGAGAMKIRRVFREARKNAPCIVFIDEIDALGRARSAAGGPGGGSEEKDATLNALLVELDGMEARAGVVLVAATNRPDVLDPALIRRGRVDRRVDVTLPSTRDRAAILKVHMAKITTDTGLADAVAGETFGMSGADLAAMVNEAALVATKRGAASVELVDFRAARDRQLIGMGSSSVQLNTTERRITAVHEAGHALVAALTPGADPIERVTIMPQGPALGFVMQRPEEDRKLATRTQLLAKLDVALGGRAAELVLLGDGMATNGVESDVAVATRIAAAMAGLWGMGNLGFVRVEAGGPLAGNGEPLRGAVQEIIGDAEERVFALVETHKDAVEALASHLLQDETLDGAQALRVLEEAGAPVPRPLGETPTGRAPTP
jgi:cell division protease FtsH